jgi:hypothetical protein
MAEIIITTDGTLANTILKVDGKEVTKNSKVVSISMYASAPYKGSMSGDIYRGNSSVAYETIDEKGVVERKSFGSDSTEYLKGIGQKIKQSDQITQYIGQGVDAEISKIIDKIVSHCETNKIPCADKETLMLRTKESLLDKATDLGIKLED